MLSKSDAIGGGAGRMANDLARWLREAGHEAVHYAKGGAQPFGTTFRPAYGRGVRAAKRVERMFLMNDVLPLEAGAVLRRLGGFRPDVVHVHDITTTFSVRTVEIISRRYPTLWTMHDQSPRTGGCITPWPCRRDEIGCGECPQFPSWVLSGRRDLTAHVHAQKRRFFARSNAMLLTPSRSAADGFEAAAVLGGRSVDVAPNGIDLTKVRPVDQADARRWLGLPAEGPVIALFAHTVDDPRKTAPSLHTAIGALADLRPFFVIMGNCANPGAFVDGQPFRHFGFVISDALKNVVLASADVFVNPSLGDTFSLTTLEALASGTPVAAYASGGIPDLTGSGPWAELVVPDDGVALGAAVRRMLTDGRLPAARAGARARAGLFDHRRMVARHLELYSLAVERAAA
ncbi:MAG: glycosyltransferase [Ilumatobacteraceae bacterium]